jgi:hypothetical protein
LDDHRRWVHDLHRTATHINLVLQDTPMSSAVGDLLLKRIRDNALTFEPGTRDGVMVSGGGFQGKTETACDIAATFEGLWRGLLQEFVPAPVPGTRDLFVPIAYCKTPVKATPKGLCQSILDFYGAPHPKTLHRLIAAVRESIKSHRTTAVLIDDITRLRMHRADDQDTLDLIRDLMDLNVTLVLIGVNIPGSGLLREGRFDPRTGKYAIPAAKRSKSFNEEASTQTERRFDLISLDPFDYGSDEGISAWITHLRGIEDQLRLLRAPEHMLTSGSMPEYLFSRTNGIVGLLKRLISDGCEKAMKTGQECLSEELLSQVKINLGNIPDRDAEAGEVPDVPPVKPRKKPGPKPRNTVFDDRGEDDDGTAAIGA